MCEMTLRPYLVVRSFGCFHELVVVYDLWLEFVDVSLYLRCHNCQLVSVKYWKTDGIIIFKFFKCFEGESCSSIKSWVHR